MKAKVIHTTDWKYLWHIYEVDSLDWWDITNATWWKFAFDNIKLNWNIITLQNSNYTVLLKII